jgi:sortase A
LLALYLIFLPVFPLLYFRLNQGLSTAPAVPGAVWQNTGDLVAVPGGQGGRLPQTEDKKIEQKKDDSNRIIIKKIGVDAPIIESKNEKYGLNRGAWRLPDSSTPDIGGNTVITGHRFKYLPPNNLTFYLLDKLEKGDKIDVRWKGKILKYEVYLTKIVPAEDTSVIAPTDEPILTVFTCDPIFSTKNRLVVLAKPIK